MGIAKITRNFQITVPRDVRELKGLKEGDEIIFAIEGDRVDLVKMDRRIVTSTAGLWTEAKETGLEYERRLRKGWAKRLHRETA